MKRFLSMALAAAMAMSIASVAFAANVKDYNNYKVDEVVYVYDEDNHKLEELSKKENKNIEFDSEVYFKIEAGKDTTAPFNDSEVAKNIKIKKTDFTEGGKYVDGVQLVKKIVDDGKGNKTTNYYVEVAIKAAPNETEAKDIIGTITFSSSKYDEVEKEQTIEIGLTAMNPDGVIGETLTDDNKVYKFGDGDEEEELELYAEAGRFVVDTRGQSDLVIKSDVEYNKGIENVASDVNYVYFNGNGATFNKIGTLYLNAEEDNFLYRVNSDGTLTKLEANYDEDEEAFAIRTRVIGSYVISEEELNVENVNSQVKPEETAPVAPVTPANPSTGAAC